MSVYNIDDLCKEMDEHIASASLCEPVGYSEFVDECAYSRTGFAIWRKEISSFGFPTCYCTCRPALKTAADDLRKESK